MSSTTINNIHESGRVALRALPETVSRLAESVGRFFTLSRAERELAELDDRLLADDRLRSTCDNSTADAAAVKRSPSFFVHPAHPAIKPAITSKPKWSGARSKWTQSMAIAPRTKKDIGRSAYCAVA